MPDMANFAMPSRLEVDEESCTDTYARFHAEPLEKGFGNTLGNAMRRVLLSSLEGVSISSINIDGVPHEFSSIPNIVEDVTDIVLNFKKVLFECSGDLPRKLELSVKKSGEVTAADIETDGVTEVLNPDQYICMLDSEREFRVELEITRGRGYRPAEENKSIDHPIGVIPVDCLFSPVKRVAYHISDCRVGQRTDFDKLEFEIWTDGRIHPSDAVKQAGQILAYHLSIFTGINGEDDDDPSKLITNEEDEALLKKLLTNVNDLSLSVRAQNCLNNANIRYVGELVQRPESEMMKYRNFGQKSLNELKDKVIEMNMHLGFELKEEVRIAFEKQLEKLKSGV
ncbi:MAG: DNA-directed RNA polymerase subunit alpha [Lentisphaeria bacterium]|nr:DNA-directed RNA polymerase subunit alpha [Lentisphaeria bacterium]NQZ67525.1 DNA-directed RNA polymerase subunit alpha [Lentisphaeria bacterium]